LNKKIFTLILASVIASNVLMESTVLAVSAYDKPNANLSVIKAAPPQIYVSDLDNGKTYTGYVTTKISNAIRKIIPYSKSSSSNTSLYGIIIVIAGAGIAMFLTLKFKAKK